MQEYYANTGALKRAAENARGDGGKVGVSIVEAFGKQARSGAFVFPFFRCFWNVSTSVAHPLSRLSACSIVAHAASLDPDWQLVGSVQVQPRELEEVLRLEYRSKLLNPKARCMPMFVRSTRAAPRVNAKLGL